VLIAHSAQMLFNNVQTSVFWIVLLRAKSDSAAIAPTWLISSWIVRMKRSSRVEEHPNVAGCHGTVVKSRIHLIAQAPSVSAIHFIGKFLPNSTAATATQLLRLKEAGLERRV
jgi:hypothetical protein